MERVVCKLYVRPANARVIPVVSVHYRAIGCGNTQSLFGVDGAILV